MMQAVPGLWVLVHLGVTDSTFARPVDKVFANLVPNLLPVYTRVFVEVFGILDLPI